MIYLRRVPRSIRHCCHQLSLHPTILCLCIDTMYQVEDSAARYLTYMPLQTTRERHANHALLGFVVMCHRDDDFPSCVSCFEIPDRFSRLTQWVTSVDNRDNFAGLKKCSYEAQILVVWFHGWHE